MMRKIILTILLALTSRAAFCGNILDSLQYDVRIGYSIGATIPYNIPASIRKLNSFTPQLDFSAGIDAYKLLGGPWGLMVGIYLERKGMDIDATVKSYKTEMVRGGETIAGNFTGRNSTEEDLWMITIPILATFDIHKVRLRLGPYASFVVSRDFTGVAYDGYMRIDSPVGAKVIVGSDKNTRGTYDFGDKMRRMQYGIKVGADWNFHRTWGAYCDLSFGVSGIFHSNFDSIEQTFYPVYGTFGVKYNLN